jgi:hypothetical protein
VYEDIGSRWLGEGLSQLQDTEPFWAVLTAHDAASAAYTWTEQGWTPAGTLADLAGGRNGSAARNPAVFPGGGGRPVNLPSFVRLQPVYFDAARDWVYAVVTPRAVNKLDVIPVSTPGVYVYAKPAGLVALAVEVVGGGGGGGGAPANDATHASVSPGGGGGGYARLLMDAAALNPAETVVVGAGGAGGTAGGAGTVGGTTYFGTRPLVLATGGQGGAAGVQLNLTTQQYVPTFVSFGGRGFGGDVNSNGSDSYRAELVYINPTTARLHGEGAASAFSGTRLERPTAFNPAGVGAGGMGNSSAPGGAAANGENGGPGGIVLYEYFN